MHFKQKVLLIANSPTFFHIPYVKEHLAGDRISHIFKHLQNSEHSHAIAMCSADCFESIFWIMPPPVFKLR